MRFFHRGMSFALTAFMETGITGMMCDDS